MNKAKILEFFKSSSLHSTAFSEYFHMLTSDNMIFSSRNGIKVLIFYFYSEIVVSHMISRSILFRPILAFVTFCTFIIIYGVTRNIQSPDSLTRITSVMVVICMGYTTLLSSDENEVIETQYSLTICIILTMYTLFRLRFMITMLMSVIYIMLLVSVGSVRLKHWNIDVTNSSIIVTRSLEQIRFPMNWKITTSRYAFITGQCILFFLVYVTGLYLRFFNSVRRKSAFMKLAQYAEAKLKMNSAVKVQIYWIEAIMPKAVKNEFLKNIGNKNSSELVYCQHFNNVTILFADIVGFTAMSSNKTAQQLVYLLNDLYNRFDEYGRIMHCEKIGTLGDCYYCVCGCPTPRPDHALCCVEMGLEMCKLILEFNTDNKENVNMRVGIHTGRVIAAIIGNHRFRFDVFSNDVLIANSMESSGEPGRVHISEDTYKLVKYSYMFEDGDLLEIKREKKHGLSGFDRKSIKIKTYFVVTEDRKNRNNISYNMSNSQKKIHLNIEKTFSTQSKSLEFEKRNEKMKYHNELVKILQQDPEKPVEFFQHPPLNGITLTFTDQEIESHFLNHCTDQVKMIKTESYKFAIYMDAIASLTFSTIILIVSFIMISLDFQIFKFYTPFVYIIGIVLTIISAWISKTFKSQIHGICMQILFEILSHPVSRLILSIYMSCLPSIMVLTMYNAKFMYIDYTYTASYFTLTIFALVSNCLYTTSYTIIKYISTIMSALVALYMLWFPIDAVLLNKNPGFSDCYLYIINHYAFHKYRLQCNYTFQLFHICILTYYLIRESERNIRIHFYATREAEIRNDEAKRAKKVAESLLYNIIPRHVFCQITKSKSNNKKDTGFSYAHAIECSGVVFACITNFFSNYYREDYKGGEAALKLLHSIICKFDNLFKKPAYANLEKIKTINDCYMLASGLNTSLVDSNEDHLIRLMHFAIEMIQQLKQFNEENIVGKDTFKLKIGYNCGPVTAGIIGTSKPLYDIWGDTVNVASRMYSTASYGSIQVSKDVANKLDSSFKFQYRGKIEMKGKGEMETYLVIGAKVKQKLNSKNSADSNDPVFGMLKRIKRKRK